MTPRERGALGGRATADRMRNDTQSDAEWRAKIGDATTQRFQSEAFRALHAEACRRAAQARHAREKAATPEK